MYLVISKKSVVLSTRSILKAVGFHVRRPGSVLAKVLEERYTDAELAIIEKFKNSPVKRTKATRGNRRKRPPLAS